MGFLKAQKGFGRETHVSDVVRLVAEIFTCMTLKAQNIGLIIGFKASQGGDTILISQ